MSLRLRLVLGIGAALLLIWAAAATWMLRDLDRQLQRTLDERLAMSAQMVAGLLAQSPVIGAPASALPVPDTITVPGRRSMACQVRSLHGEIVATTQGAPTDAMADAPAGYASRDIDGGVWRTYTLVTPTFRITTADSLVERDGLRRGIALAAGVPFLMGGLGGLLALWWGVGRGLSPLDRLRAALARRVPDDTTPLAAGPMPAELAPLLASLNALLQRLAGTVLRERSFTSDAAHELRTPLTAIDTHLQVALLASGDDARQAVHDAREGAQALHANLEQLLMLARVEGRVSFDEGAQAGVWEVLDEALRQLPNAAARIHASGGPLPQRLAVPSALARVALRNLLDNALRYSPLDARIDVVVGIDAGNACYRILDRGAGVDPEQALKRFWRADRSTAPGTGLGLTIVQAIVDRCGGSLVLARAEGGGTEARLCLPLAADGAGRKSVR